MDDTIDLLEEGDPDADDPLVRTAPDDPKAANEYYALKNKKAKSPAQALWMRRRIAELEVLRPLSQTKRGLGQRVLSRAVGPPGGRQQPHQGVFV